MKVYFSSPSISSEIVERLKTDIRSSKNRILTASYSLTKPSNLQSIKDSRATI